MISKKLTVRYLPFFSQDLKQTLWYIKNILKNNVAAEILLIEIEKAILERSESASCFKPYLVSDKYDYPYYRIRVKNYMIFYVVIDDLMEIRRLVRTSRDTKRYL